MGISLVGISATIEKRTGLRAQDVGVWLVAVGFAVWLGLLSWISREWTAPVMVAGTVALAAILVRVLGLQAGLVLTLIITSVVDRYTFRVGSLDLRGEQVAALIALVVLVVVRLRAADWTWIKVTLPEAILVAWFAVNVVSSLLDSPDRRLSAKNIALVAISALGLALPRRLLAGPAAAAHLETVTRWVLVVFATESAWGAIAYLLHVFGPTISLAANPATGHLSAYGTLWEQNVFGAFAGAGAIAWAYLGPKRFERAWLGLALCLGGLLDSFTRAAWLATALVGALGAFLSSLRRRVDLMMIAVAAIATLPFIAATLAVDRLGRYVIITSGGPPTKSTLLTVLLSLVDVVGRVNQGAPVLHDIRGHLVLGRGTASYEALYISNGVPQHVASLPLLILNDTGLLGLVVFAAFVIAVIARAWTQRSQPLVVAYGQMAIVVGLTNLATETTELMVGWLLIGLLLAAADHAAPEQPGAG